MLLLNQNICKKQNKSYVYTVMSLLHHLYASVSYLYLDALAFHLLSIKTSKLPQTADKKNEACVVKPCIKSCL